MGASGPDRPGVGRGWVLAGLRGWRREGGAGATCGVSPLVRGGALTVSGGGAAIGGSPSGGTAVAGAGKRGGGGWEVGEGLGCQIWKGCPYIGRDD